MITNTLIVIGVGRLAVLGYFTNGVFAVDEFEQGAVVEAGDPINPATGHPKGKVMCTFTTPTPPLDAIKALILRYPHSRFVLYWVDEVKGVRGGLQGRNGAIQKEFFRTDKEAWK